MKKLILLCVAYFCLQVVGAQEAKEKAKKAKKETEKVVQDKKAKAKKETQKLKKDGTPDKRFKENQAAAKGEAKAAAGKAKAAGNKAKAKKLSAAEEKEDLKESTLSKAAEKKVKDKVTGTYKGRKVYTGPRGGKYYINKNGNKTYIDGEREE